MLFLRKDEAMVEKKTTNNPDKKKKNKNKNTHTQKHTQNSHSKMVALVP